MPCSRCSIIDTDKETAEKETQGNLQMMGKTRRFSNYAGKAGAMFGVQAIFSDAIGDTLRVAEILAITELSQRLPSFPRLT